MTRDKALDELAVLEERFSRGMGWTDGNYVEALQVAHDAIEAQRWIPCSERMPEAFDRVFCFQPKALCKAMWIGHFDNVTGFWVTDDGWEQYTNPVTAWMPLPEPYKGGK